MDKLTNHDQIQQRIETLVETTDLIDGVKDLGNMFHLDINGGEDEAMRVVTAIEETDALGDGDEVQTVIDPETDEPDVRIVSDSLKEAEQRVSENLREFMNEYC
jgi:hypothetical protein